MSIAVDAERFPFVSVVVPVFNEEGFIEGCLQALLQQDYPTDRREFIVVDNNSTDRTTDIIKKFPVTLAHERQIQTSYAARNKGIAVAKGEIIAFTDADCLPHDDWLSRLVEPFQRRAVIGVVGQMIAAENSGTVAAFLRHMHPVQSRERDGWWYVITANAAYRRSALDSVGGFRSDWFTAGDIELGLRLQTHDLGQIVAACDAKVEHVYENSVTEMWKRYRRYGYSEVLIKVLGQNTQELGRVDRNMAQVTGDQLRALVTYGVSFIWRLRKLPVQGWKTEYNYWPILFAVAESGNLYGRLQAQRVYR